MATVNQLQDIIHEKLHEIQDVIVCDEKDYGKLPVLHGAVAPTINFEAVVIGALEQSFLEMVKFQYFAGGFQCPSHQAFDENMLQIVATI